YRDVRPTASLDWKSRRAPRPWQACRNDCQSGDARRDVRTACDRRTGAHPFGQWAAGCPGKEVRRDLAPRPRADVVWLFPDDVWTKERPDELDRVDPRIKPSQPRVVPGRRGAERRLPGS